MAGYNQGELLKLEQAIELIDAKAREFGLDCFPMRFELVPSDIIYTFGAYGMPTRFSHWSFGKAFHRMKTQYDYNLTRIYELVINSSPCYAFLLEGNSLIQNKLVVAHVYGHCDFFKNNYRFQGTSRQMVETMAVSARRMREYEFQYGQHEVERWLDAALSIQEHIDPRPLPVRKTRSSATETQQALKPATAYDDLWAMDKTQDIAKPPSPQQAEKFPPRPGKDLLQFIATYGHGLKQWQRDTITMVREEMLYFWPQIETKIMNEGWASFWHAKIIHELDLDPAEAVEFAKMHAAVLQPSRTSLNPYHIGCKIFQEIERRWDSPSMEDRERSGMTGNQGKDKIFEVRAMETDSSFLRNYLTRDLVKELNLYIYQKIGDDWQVVETNWESVRDGIVAQMINCGFPYIEVEDGDYQKNGELYLIHRYEGVELDIDYLEKTLPHLYTVWGKTVHLETLLENKPVIFSHDGQKNLRRSQK